MLHTRFALRRPVTTLMTFVAVSLIGIIATTLLPLEMFPDIRFPGIAVNIPYAGSTPEEVEQLITRPAEEAIAALPGVKEMRSTSSENGAELIVFFEWGRDPAAVRFEVGLTNEKGWCSVDMLTMESAVHKDIWVVGDSCVHGELPVYAAPKSAHSAVTQAKVAAGAIIAKLNGQPAPEPFFATPVTALLPRTGDSRWCTSTGWKRAS